MKLSVINSVYFDVINHSSDFCIHQILEKEWDYNGTTDQPFTCRLKENLIQLGGNLKLNVIEEFLIPMKSVGQIQMYLN